LKLDGERASVFPSKNVDELSLWAEVANDWSYLARRRIASERHATRRVPFPRRRRPISFAVEADERSKVEAAGIEIYRDANKTERLLHIQELGVPGDPIVSAMIWCPRAERGQSATAIIGVPLLGALSTEPWRYRRRRDRGILPSWPRPLPPRLSPKRLP
jgi:hypothetical protein